MLAIDTQTERFPAASLEAFDGGIAYIDYEWQTRRYPVNADVQERGTPGRFAVTAGRSDEITDPLMDRGDREERKLRARYVRAAVAGRNVKEGEEQTIPRSRDGVEQLVAALETDRQTVDETAYDLFGLTADERESIEEYLDVF